MLLFKYVGTDGDDGGDDYCFIVVVTAEFAVVIVDVDVTVWYWCDIYVISILYIVDIFNSIYADIDVILCGRIWILKLLYYKLKFL